MKKIIFISILLLVVMSVRCQNNIALMDSGNTAYATNKFQAAIGFYQQIISNGYESAELYYNIGNAHFKSQHNTLAILFYEKAKKIAPADEDIEYNLKLAEKKLVDKIEPLPQLFIKNWWDSFLSLFSEKTWSLIFIGSIWCMFIGLLIYFILKNRIARQIGLLIAFCSLIFSLLFFFIAAESKSRVASQKEAIVLSSTVNLKGSPSQDGTNLFVLHEGTKVRIEQSSDDWVEIKISNGSRGWILLSELAVI